MKICACSFTLEHFSYIKIDGMEMRCASGAGIINKREYNKYIKEKEKKKREKMLIDIVSHIITEDAFRKEI